MSGTTSMPQVPQILPPGPPFRREDTSPPVSRRGSTSEGASPGASSPSARRGDPRYCLRRLMEVAGIEKVTELAEHLGISRFAIYKRFERGLPEYEADRVACRLGLHPAVVWGWSWVEDALPDEDMASEPVAAEGGEHRAA